MRIALALLKTLIAQSSCANRLASKPVLLKFKRIIVRRMQSNAPEDNGRQDIATQIWADMKHQSRIDLKLYPHDGSKYRAFVSCGSVDPTITSTTSHTSWNILSRLIGYIVIHLHIKLLATS